MGMQILSSAGRCRAVCLTLVGLGFATSGYLLARTFALSLDQSLDSIDVCSAMFGRGCDEALLSVTSWKMVTCRISRLINGNGPGSSRLVLCSSLKCSRTTSAYTVATAC